MHGSVFVLAKARSSFLGLKSVFFCRCRILNSHATISIHFSQALTLTWIRTRAHTVSELLYQFIRLALYPDDDMVIEDAHLPSDSNG